LPSFSEIGGDIDNKSVFGRIGASRSHHYSLLGEKRDYSNPIVVKIGKYVVLAGLLVDTAQFAMAILILATIVLIAIIEIVRRKRVKPSKTSS
jgi:hypothetical protein